MLLSLRQSHFSIPRLIFSTQPILPVSSLFYSGFSLILLDCFQSFKIPTHHPHPYLDFDAAVRYQPNDIQDDLGPFSSIPSRRFYIKTTDLPANGTILQPRPHQSIIHARAASSAAQKPRWQKKAACFIEIIQYISFVKCVCCFSTQFVRLNHNICVPSSRKRFLRRAATARPRDRSRNT